MDISNENPGELLATMAEKARVVFDLCDSEAKGFITKRDMLKLKDELPLSLEQLEVVFNNLDNQQLGYLTVHEFTQGFGNFLGLSPTSLIADFDYTCDDLPEDESNISSKNFNTLIENFSDCGKDEDARAIKSLWMRLSKQQPEMLTNLEDFVSRVVSMLQKNHLDYKALRASIENRKSAYDEEFRILCAEMEAQISEEKIKIRVEERKKEKQLREKLEFELQEKERRLQELEFQQKQMEDKVKEMNINKAFAQRENEFLMEEKSLMEKEYQNSEQNSESNQVQLTERSGKHVKHIDHQRRISLEISEWIALERKSLVKQIQNLERENRMLIDKQDEYEEKMVSPRRQAINSETIVDEQFLRNFSVDDDVMIKDVEIISNCSQDEDDSSLDSSVTSRVYKVVFVGDSGVGKSTFICRVCSKSFVSKLSSTIGMDFHMCNIHIDEKLVVLQLWDTAGQERYRSFSNQYFRKADGVIAMYDITNIDSFLHVRSWLEDIHDSIERNTAIMVIGSKYDCIEKGNMTSNIFPGEARKLAYEFGASFFETSAKTGHNIEECMLYLAKVLIDREDENIAKSLMVLSDGKSNHKKTFCCSTGNS